MCEKLDPGTIIVTLSLVTHGVIINTNISPEDFSFNNTRLFSLSGDFSQVIMHPNVREQNGVTYLNKIFQKDLQQPTSEIVEVYKERQQSNYKSYIETHNIDLPIEAICKTFQQITSDKVLSTKEHGSDRDDTTITFCGVNWIPMGRTGIFVISVHKKIKDNSLTLLYPTKDNVGENLNLLKTNELFQFAELFHQNTENISRILSNALLPSSPFPRITANMSQKEINKCLAKLFIWNLTMSDDEYNIDYIRMSYLVKIIKQIVGNTCKINIFDYTCSIPNGYLNSEDMKKLSTSTIGTNPDASNQTWGGRRKTRIRKNKKNKTKRKRLY